MKMKELIKRKNYTAVIKCAGEPKILVFIGRILCKPKIDATSKH